MVSIVLSAGPALHPYRHEGREPGDTLPTWSRISTRNMRATYVRWVWRYSGAGCLLVRKSSWNRPPDSV